jgi:hypothetical protein
MVVRGQELSLALLGQGHGAGCDWEHRATAHGSSGTSKHPASHLNPVLKQKTSNNSPRE